MTTGTSRDGAPPRLVVARGGEPRPEELAALLVALAAGGGRAAGRPRAVPAWTRAALVEGVGGRTVVAPGDLDRPGWDLG